VSGSACLIADVEPIGAGMDYDAMSVMREFAKYSKEVIIKS
jgi:hypothetical protein